MTARRTKLAIAAAILIVGVGTAVLLPRDNEESLVAAQPTKSVPKPVAQQPTTAERPAERQPSLTGQIEPYGGWNSDEPGTERVKPAGMTNAELNPNRGAGNHGLTPNRGQSVVRADSPLSPQAAPTGELPGAVAAPLAGLSADKSDPFDGAFKRFEKQDATREQATRKTLHRIVDGDTLAALAKRYLESEDRYLDFFEYNRQILTSPELLPIGKELRIPPTEFRAPARSQAETPATALADVRPPIAPPTPGAAAAEPRGAASPAAPPVQPDTYVVQPHDTLALIARKIYGDIDRQSELLAANRQQLRTSRDLRPGMKLILPVTRP